MKLFTKALLLLFAACFCPGALAEPPYQLRGVDWRRGISDLDIIRWDSETAKIFSWIGNSTKHVHVASLNVLSFEEGKSWEDFPRFKSPYMLMLRDAEQLDLETLLEREEYGESLQQLVIANSTVRSADIEAISRLPHLFSLRLSGCDVTATSFRPLSRAEELLNYSVTASQLTVRQLEELSEIQSLESLRIESEQISEATFFALGELRRLNRLTIRTNAIDEAVFEAFSIANPQVQVVVATGPYLDRWRIVEPQR